MYRDTWYFLQFESFREQMGLVDVREQLAERRKKEDNAT
jgi:hypothetical protein